MLLFPHPFGMPLFDARFYLVASPERRKKFGDDFDAARVDINWTHPVLKDRIRVEKYNTEEQDAFEAAAKTTSTRRRLRRTKGLSNATFPSKTSWTKKKAHTNTTKLFFKSNHHN